MSKAPVVLQDQSTRLAGSKLYVVFLSLQLALFLSFLDSTSVATAIPIIGRDLNASESVTWVSFTLLLPLLKLIFHSEQVGTSFLVANTSFQTVTSRLSDVFGRKVVLLAALGVFVLGPPLRIRPGRHLAILLSSSGRHW